MNISNNSTLIILDWDDTLFPTSWVNKNNIEIIDYLEKINMSGDEDNYVKFLKEKNKWALNLESKKVNIINSFNILDSITVGKEEISCGFQPEGLIKNFDLLLKTSTSTSRKQT